MTAIIYQQDLDFLEEAKRSFEKHPRYETYRNIEDTHIALRYGADRDCIMIYKLGEEVMFANNIMNSAPDLVVGAQRGKPDEVEEGDVLIGIQSGRLGILIKHYSEYGQVEVKIQNGRIESWNTNLVELYAKKVGESND